MVHYILAERNCFIARCESANKSPRESNTRVWCQVHRIPLHRRHTVRCAKTSAMPRFDPQRRNRTTASTLEYHVRQSFEAGLTRRQRKLQVRACVMKAAAELGCFEWLRSSCSHTGQVEFGCLSFQGRTQDRKISATDTPSWQSRDSSHLTPMHINDGPNGRRADGNRRKGSVAYWCDMRGDYCTAQPDH